MTAEGNLLEVLEALERQGWAEAEVFHKRGRSRTMQFTAYGDATSLRQEEGWAVRAGDQRRSFFYAQSGAPRFDVQWPEADGLGLRLPSPRLVPPWAEPSSLDAPLLGENEARGFFEGLARQLDDELPGARLLGGHLDDGSSEGNLASSREVVANIRQRATSIVLEAVGPGGEKSLTLEVAERDPRRLSPAALARRLADLLLVAEKGSAWPRDRGEFLLAPPVTAALLAALQGLWLGADAPERVAALRGRRGRIGSQALTLIDDGRLPGGILEAAVDGEGQPTREVVLVEEGSFRQPLVAWWQTVAKPKRASGCNHRASWRDLPRPGASHLYLQPDRTTRVAELLEDLSRGYYLIGTSGTPRIDDNHERFAVPVSGFAISGGRPSGAVSSAWLVGAVSTLLNGLVAKARDLSFSPIGHSMVGAPTVLVKGTRATPEGLNRRPCQALHNALPAGLEQLLRPVTHDRGMFVAAGHDQQIPSPQGRQDVEDHAERRAGVSTQRHTDLIASRPSRGPGHQVEDSRQRRLAGDHRQQRGLGQTRVVQQGLDHLQTRILSEMGQHLRRAPARDRHLLSGGQTTQAPDQVFLGHPPDRGD